MASIEIPGQNRRWGNESTNFFHHSRTPNPGVPARQKIYRCDDSQYTNCGHQHIGAKCINLKLPSDTYGTRVAFKLRSEDQRLPRPMSSNQIHAHRLSMESGINLYQSHKQTYQGSAMPSILRRSSSDSHFNADALAASLNKAFYTTSYQSDTSKTAAGWKPKLIDDCQTLRGELTTRSPALSSRAYQRVKSAPPIRSTTNTTNPPVAPEKGIPPRPRRFTLSEQYPSRAEMLREICKTFPSPQPGKVNLSRSRPSSAANTVRIQGLRMHNK